MRELSKLQLWVILVALMTGIVLIITHLIAVVFISTGYTIVIMAVILAFLECGPRVWHWWVPFRLGTRVRLPSKIHINDGDEIDEWLSDNVKFRFLHTRNGEIYYFLRNTDATGFKLRFR